MFVNKNKFRTTTLLRLMEPHFYIPSNYQKNTAYFYKMRLIEPQRCKNSINLKQKLLSCFPPQSFQVRSNQSTRYPLPRQHELQQPATYLHLLQPDGFSCKPHFFADGPLAMRLCLGLCFLPHQLWASV